MMIARRNPAHELDSTTIAFEYRKPSVVAHNKGLYIDARRYSIADCKCTLQQVPSIVDQKTTSVDQKTTIDVI
jgi:hypothetical protein